MTPAAPADGLMCRNGCGRRWVVDFGSGRLCRPCDDDRREGVGSSGRRQASIPLPTHEPAPHWADTDQDAF